jgi:hypothetical protein
MHFFRVYACRREVGFVLCPLLRLRGSSCRPRSRHFLRQSLGSGLEVGVEHIS